jgi:hypothetical protein
MSIFDHQQQGRFERDSVDQITNGRQKHTQTRSIVSGIKLTI